MELELKFAELACCEPVGDLVTTQEESMETAIPEYCPDIARIVDTVGQLRLREKQCRLHSEMQVRFQLSDLSMPHQKRSGHL